MTSHPCSGWPAPTKVPHPRRCPGAFRPRPAAGQAGRPSFRACDCLAGWLAGPSEPLSAHLSAHCPSVSRLVCSRVRLPVNLSLRAFRPVPRVDSACHRHPRVRGCRPQVPVLAPAPPPYTPTCTHSRAHSIGPTDRATAGSAEGTRFRASDSREREPERQSGLQTHPREPGPLCLGSRAPPGATSASPSLTGYYFEIPSIGAIRINTQVRLWGAPSSPEPPASAEAAPVTVCSGA